jgi:hypothetical protein
MMVKNNKTLAKNMYVFLTEYSMSGNDHVPPDVRLALEWALECAEITLESIPTKEAAIKVLESWVDSREAEIEKIH